MCLHSIHAKVKYVMRILMPAMLSPSGISRATREYYKLIKWLGLPVTTLLGLNEHLPLLEKSVVDSMIHDSGMLPDGDEYVHFYVGTPGGMGMMPKASGTIGVFFFEGTQLSPLQVAPARMTSIIGAPSSFCHSGLLRSGISPAKIKRIPIPLDESVWNQSVQPAFPFEGRFRFLFMNSIYERKGLDVLLRAYWQTFSKRDPVELYVKSYKENDRPDPAAKYIAAVAEKYRFVMSECAPVRVLDVPMRDEEIPSFIKSFDAVVSMHRSEGFGLTPFYAMALGTPVVATDFGGVTDFCKEDTAWIVNVDRMSEPSSEETRIFDHLRGAMWAEPSIESASQTLRRCINDHQGRAEKAERARVLLSDNYSYAKVGSAIVSAIEGACPGFTDKVKAGKTFINERYEGQPFKMIEL
jgi:glycosyltransferase involved in cell wall biosynthesis